MGYEKKASNFHQLRRKLASFLRKYNTGFNSKTSKYNFLQLKVVNNDIDATQSRAKAEGLLKLKDILLS
jgi:hypothetical protein